MVTKSYERMISCPPRIYHRFSRMSLRMFTLEAKNKRDSFSIVPLPCSWPIIKIPLRAEENLTKQFIGLFRKIPFRNIIFLMDGGILCSEIFFEAIKLGYTAIDRLNPVMDVVFNGTKMPLTSLRKQTKGTTFVIVTIPRY